MRNELAMSQMSLRRREVICVGEVVDPNNDWRCNACGHYFLLNHGRRGCTFPVLKEGIVEQCRCSVTLSGPPRGGDARPTRPTTKPEREDILGYGEAGV